MAGLIRERLVQSLRFMLLASGYALLLLPKLLSLAVPKRKGLYVFGAGQAHVDNILGILLARPGPPAGCRIVVVASRQHRHNALLRQAVAALPDARIVARHGLPAVWACLRADWVLLPAFRRDAQQYWLSRSRLVYINHGPWMKAMPAPIARHRRRLLLEWLFGRYKLVLASHEGEVADYRAWMGADVPVVCLGYPRAPLLDSRFARGTQPGKVGLYPTWKPFNDPSYTPELAARLAQGLHAAGVRDPCVRFSPHHLTGQPATTLGEDDGRPPQLLVTDFSSMAFDQFYGAGHVLLYSARIDDYLAARGLRPAMATWFRAHALRREADLQQQASAILHGRQDGVPAPFVLRPFQADRFWSLLHAP